MNDLYTGDELQANDNAPEGKSVGEPDEAKFVVPGNITTFQELWAWVEARATTDKLQDLVYAFERIVSNIMFNPNLFDKPQALINVSKEFQTELMKTINDATDNIKQEEAARESGFFMQKQADGTYRWLAIWSTNTQDNDRPPDIIEKAAFTQYIESLQKGDAAFPVLWMYHQGGLKWGQADMVTFAPVEGSGIGFAIASGIVDKGCEDIAERFLPENRTSNRAIGVSHGMRGIHRKRINGQNVITKFHTFEISPLFLEEAANKLTGFEVE